MGVSRQPSRFMRVDFPEPLGPMTATNSPRRMVEVHAAQRLERGVSGAVGLGEAVQFDEGFRAHVGWAGLMLTMTGGARRECAAGDFGDAAVGDAGVDGDLRRVRRP